MNSLLRTLPIVLGALSISLLALGILAAPGVAYAQQPHNEFLEELGTAICWLHCGCEVQWTCEENNPCRGGVWPTGCREDCECFGRFVCLCRAI